MALIACPECDGQVSNRAPACPHCGFPLGSSAGPLPTDGASPARGGGDPSPQETLPSRLKLEALREELRRDVAKPEENPTGQTPTQGYYNKQDALAAQIVRYSLDSEKSPQKDRKSRH